MLVLKHLLRMKKISEIRTASLWALTRFVRDTYIDRVEGTNLVSQGIIKDRHGDIVVNDENVVDLWFCGEMECRELI